MPANVTPAYEKAERRYREAATDEDKLVALQDMLRTIPKHKGTDKMQADIKRRISLLRKSQAKQGKKKGPDPFHIPKGGAGQVVLIGPANTGKSSVVAAVTNAEVKVADYPFTTVVPAPGMWERNDVQIELVDTPPMSADHVPSGLMGTIRAADVVCVVVDAAGDALEEAESILTLFADREVQLRTVPRPRMDRSDPGALCGLLAATKTDRAAPGTVNTLKELYAGALDVYPISSRTGDGLGALFDRLWELLGVIRVYSKQPGAPPDLSQPFTVPIGSTLEDLARAIHRDLPERMKHARIWGEGRFDGQHVHRTEVLRDRDVVEIHE